MPEVQAQAYVVLAALLVQLGCLPLARDAADRAVQLSEGAELKVQGWAWIEKGEVLAASKQYAEARKAFLEARRRIRECGDHPHEVTVEGNIGECLRGLGRNDQARARFVKAVELARRYGARGATARAPRRPTGWSSWQVWPTTKIGWSKPTPTLARRCRSRTSSSIS